MDQRKVRLEEGAVSFGSLGAAYTGAVEKRSIRRGAAISPCADGPIPGACRD